MMSCATTNSPTPAKPPRLRFIDMARSVAILLMLEGHFVDNSLLPAARNPEHAAYAAWSTVRAFTAPMFLTVTGLIFVYLLLRNDEQPWHRNIRVRKGSKRVLELFFWGYVVQSYAFHILECIACGIALILIIYGIHKLLRVIPLWLCFLMTSLAIFSLLPAAEAWPKRMSPVEHSWWMLTSPIHGRQNPMILFSIIPYAGFTLMGATIGCLARELRDHIHSWWFPCMFALIGAALQFFAGDLLGMIQNIGEVITSKPWVSLADTEWLYERAGMVLIVISLLIWIDQRWGMRMRPDNLFLQIGQNTLVIYILHMVVLYGSIFGYGINDFTHKQLGPWQSAIGAALFIVPFIVLVHYLGAIRSGLLRIKKAIFRQSAPAEP